MTLPLRRPYPPMEAKSVENVPSGPEWQYEPKWDGFRCLAFRDGRAIALQSKAGEPLERYFPEMVAALKKVKASRFVLDGELVIPHETSLSFDDLLMRIHPAESRIKKLSIQTPALLIVFDLLVDDQGKLLVSRPLSVRRKALEAFAKRCLARSVSVVLSPATTERSVALRWFRSTGGALDGVIAKHSELPYRSGDRTGMQKIKQRRTADCVVGGFRYASKGGAIGSLLLGLYDDDGLLVPRQNAIRWLRAKRGKANSRCLHEHYGWRKPGGRMWRWWDDGASAFETASQRVCRCRHAWITPPDFVATSI